MCLLVWWMWLVVFVFVLYFGFLQGRKEEFGNFGNFMTSIVLASPWLWFSGHISQSLFLFICGLYLVVIPAKVCQVLPFTSVSLLWIITILYIAYAFISMSATQICTDFFFHWHQMASAMNFIILSLVALVFLGY